MKILLDPVYTHKPSICSTSYPHAGDRARPVGGAGRWFFYLLYPSKFASDETEQTFLAAHAERVSLIPIDQHDRDRIWEMFLFTKELKTLVASGNSPCWDADVLITSRIPQIPTFRASSGRRNAFGGWVTSGCGSRFDGFSRDPLTPPQFVEALAARSPG